MSGFRLHWRSGRAGIALGALLISVSASALEKPLDLAACAAIQNSVERLRCYDRLAGRRPDTDRTAPPAKGRKQPAGVAEKEPALEKRIEEQTLAAENPFAITPYRPNYLLPVTYNSTPNKDAFDRIEPGTSIDHAEVKFQISLQFDLWRDIANTDMDLYFGYTQQSWWQLYNAEASSPFRETNYEPEIGVKFPTGFSLLGLRNRQIRVGFVHQSNGRADPLSRSWNRLFAIFLLERGNLAMALRPWVRIPESGDKDDNPDITDYMGYGEVYGFYKWRKHTFGGMARNFLDLDDWQGAFQLDWSYPLTPRLKWYVQYFNGFGESLIDHDHYTNRLGAGFMLTDWL